MNKQFKATKIDEQFDAGEDVSEFFDMTKPVVATSFDDNPLLAQLTEEKNGKISGGIYHKLQVEFTYNLNHIEGSRLSKDQTRFIFETASLDPGNNAVRVDDMKLFYYRGLAQWSIEQGYLTDTCLAAQDTFKAWLDYFRIPYDQECS